MGLGSHSLAPILPPSLINRTVSVDVKDHKNEKEIGEEEEKRKKKMERKKGSAAARSSVSPSAARGQKGYDTLAAN